MSPQHRSFGRSALKAASDQVRGVDQLLTVDGCPLPGFRVPTAQAGGLHQPVDPLAGQPVTTAASSARIRRTTELSRARTNGSFMITIRVASS
jgi:hypothetical protein